MIFARRQATRLRWVRLVLLGCTTCLGAGFAGLGRAGSSFGFAQDPFGFFTQAELVNAETNPTLRFPVM